MSNGVSSEQLELEGKAWKRIVAASVFGSRLPKEFDTVATASSRFSGRLFSICVLQRTASRRQPLEYGAHFFALTGPYQQTREVIILAVRGVIRSYLYGLEGHVTAVLLTAGPVHRTEAALADFVRDFELVQAAVFRMRRSEPKFGRYCLGHVSAA